MQGLCVASDIKKILLNKYTREGYKNVHIVTEKGSNDGDGYIAKVVRVLITGEKDGEKTNVDLIVKCGRNDPEVRSVVPTTQLFRREIFVYNYVIPHYRELQKELLVSEEQKCGFIDSSSACDKYLEEYIVLKNMKLNGYRLSDKSDYKHAIKVYEMLGKFHALSYIFEKRYKAEFDYAASNIDTFLYFNDLDEFNSSGCRIYMEKAACKFIDCLENEKHKSMISEAIGNSALEKIIQLTKSSKRKVISHGDFWLNNVFFYYQHNEPVRALPVDFQSCKYESPMNDFLHFIAGSSDADLRSHFWELFDVYYDSLKAFVAACGYDVEEFYSYEEMKKELQDQAVFVFCVSIFMFPFLTSYEGEKVQSHLLYSGKYPESFLHKNEAYNKCVNDLVRDFVQLGLLK